MRHSPRTLALGLLAALALPLRAGPLEETAARASNLFALDLYARLAGGEGNLVFSPYGVGALLSMAYAGAAGETAETMRNVLYLPAEPTEPDAPSAHDGHEALKRRLLAAAGNDAELNIANALWGQTESAFRPDYIGRLRDLYGAPIERLDFRGAPEAAAERINGWVADKTRGRIREIVESAGFGEQTRLVLTNAIHFKGSWEHPFDKERTKEAPFTVREGETVTVPMMKSEEMLHFAETGKLRLLELPFAAHRLTMVILLPTAPLAEMESELSTELLGRTLAAGRRRNIALSLPRFQTASSFDLREALLALGMKSAFSEAADFSGMNANRDLFVAGVHHRARLAVDEEGVEAAAATEMAMALGEAPGEALPFVVDRPFLYLIREKTTGCILFLGRVSDPTK